MATPEAGRAAAALLARARDDLAAAEALLDVASVTDAIVGFHAQQAVEKAYAVRLRYDEVPGELVTRAEALVIATAALAWATGIVEAA